MLKMYEREGCPHCAKVRRFFTSRGVSYQAVNMPKLGSERRELLQNPAAESAEVPALLDGDKLIQGSDEIIEYVKGILPDTGFDDPAYGLTRTLKGTSYSDAVPAVTAALSTEGFGVLTEIDVRATFKKKLDVDFRNYVILGACNPPLAHKALSAEPGMGLLLPCNVVVTEDNEGNAVVSAIDPRQMFRLVRHPDLEAVAEDVGDRLRRVLASLPG